MEVDYWDRDIDKPVNKNKYRGKTKDGNGNNNERKSGGYN